MAVESQRMSRTEFQPGAGSAAPVDCCMSYSKQHDTVRRTHGTLLRTLTKFPRIRIGTHLKALVSPAKLYAPAGSLTSDADETACVVYSGVDRLQYVAAGRALYTRGRSTLAHLSHLAGWG